MVIGTRLRSRGTRAFYRVRIPAATRAAATESATLHKAGGACVVLKSSRRVPSPCPAERGGCRGARARGSRNQQALSRPTLPRLATLPASGEGESAFAARYTSFTFFSGRLRTGLPVAAKIAFITAGATTQMVGSPTPPQKS